jgi:hypothetical protein
MLLIRPYTVGGAFGYLHDGQHDAIRAGRYQIFELKHLLDMKILPPNAEAGDSANARLYQDLGLDERELAIGPRSSVTSRLPRGNFT